MASRLALPLVLLFAVHGSLWLTVKAEDSLGNIDTSFNGSVTVSNYWGNYSGYGGMLGGTTTVTAVNGVQVFDKEGKTIHWHLPPGLFQGSCREAV